MKEENGAPGLGLEPIQHYIQWVADFFPWGKAAGVILTIYLHLLQLYYHCPIHGVLRGSCDLMDRSTVGLSTTWMWNKIDISESSFTPTHTYETS